MANLPTDRSTSNTASEHVDDHNTLHAFHNLIDAKGDLVAGTGANTAGRLAAGTDGHVLTAASGQTTGLQWAAVDLSSKADALVATNTQTGSYTLVIGDAGKVVEMNVGSANDLTVPPNSSVAFSTGTVIEVFQYGAGQTTIVAGSGVTIRSSGGKLKLTGQYSAASLRKRATDEWVLQGDIAS